MISNINELYNILALLPYNNFSIQNHHQIIGNKFILNKRGYPMCPQLNMEVSKELHQYLAYYMLVKIKIELSQHQRDFYIQRCCFFTKIDIQDIITQQRNSKLNKI